MATKLSFKQQNYANLSGNYVNDLRQKGLVCIFSAIIQPRSSFTSVILLYYLDEKFKICIC